MERSAFHFHDAFSDAREVGSVALCDNRRQAAQFTVMIPTYHRLGTLKAAIDSVLASRVDFPFHILVMDNDPAEADAAKEALAPYVGIEGFACYYNEQNIGAQANWNRGYELAQTEYVCILHDDDAYRPDYLQTVHDLLLAHPEIDGLHVESDAFVEGQNAVKRRALEKRYARLPDGLETVDLRYFRLVGPLPPCGFAVKRECFLRAGGYSRAWVNAFDFAFQIYFASHFRMAFYHGGILTHYNTDENSSSSSREVRIHIVNEELVLRRQMAEQQHKNDALLIQGKMWKLARVFGLARGDVAGLWPKAVGWPLSYLVPIYINLKLIFWRDA